MNLVKFIGLLSLVFGFVSASSAETLKCPSLHNDQHGDLRAVVTPVAIIGPTNDWVSITDRPKKWNISDEMVNEILAAGLNLNCDAVEGSNPITLNAWLLQGTKTEITTNAHAFYDESQRKRAPLADCYAQSLADVLDSISNPNSIPKSYLDPDSIKVATTDPYHGDPPTDRAVAKLKTALTSAKPLAMPAEMPKLQAGDEIFVVSRRPSRMRSVPGDKEPVMLRTTVGQVIPQWNGHPGGLMSEVDDLRGDSAALYLVRDKADPTRLVPIAIQKGSFEQVRNDGTAVDNLPWKPFENSSVALILDSNFYNF